MPLSVKYTKLTTYPQVVNYLIRTYAIDENIAYNEGEMTMFAQPRNKSPSQYAEKLAVKAF